MKQLEKSQKKWLSLLQKIRIFIGKNFLVSDPSQLGESTIIAFMIDCLHQQGHELPKTFLELGANSPYTLSCSWYLEKGVGFKGVSIDPLGGISREFAKYRKNTRFINRAFVPSSSVDTKIAYFQSDCCVLSTTDEHEANAMSAMGYSFKKYVVDTVKYQDLQSYYKERIGVLILDIESLQLQLEIVQELARSKIRPFIICVETIDFSLDAKNLREEYDNVLKESYRLVAGTYLNSIYLCSSIGS